MEVAASILTIVGAVGVGIKLADKISAIRDAPEAVLALRKQVELISEEVLDVQSILQDAKANNLSCPRSLILALENLRRAVKKLNKRIDRCLEKHQNNLIRYGTCYRAQRKFEVLLEQILRERVALNLAKGSLNLDSNKLTRSDVRSSSATIGGMIFVLYETVKHGFERLDATQPRNQALLMLTESSNVPGLPELDGSNDQHGNNITLDHDFDDKEALPLPSDPDPPPETCPPHCSCRCHTSNNFQSPAFLRPIVGELSVGYTMSTVSCNESHCRQTARHSTVLYTLPTCYWRKVLVCSVMGPDLSLRWMNIRDPSCWKFRGLLLLKNEATAVQETRRQLEDKELSVRDMFPSGVTALHLAMYSDLHGISKALAMNRADIHYKDQDGRSPYMIAWERRLTQGESYKLELTENFFADRSHFIDFQFTILHKAYLGIVQRDFEDLVDNTAKHYINEGDRQGRTVLSWAAARNDYITVKFLRDSGAALEQASIDGWTPLHYAAEADGTETLELLLKAKVDIEAETKTGKTALQIASRNSRVPKMMQCLIARNADVNKCGRSGFTPLEHTFVSGSVAMTKALLDAGADCSIDLVNFAIYHNAYEALALLLARLKDKNFDQHNDDDDEDTFHYVVHHASILTVEVLTNSWPSDIDTSIRTSCGRSVQAAAEWRRDCNVDWAKEYALARDSDPKAWYRAYEGMVDAIETRQRENGTPVDSSEDGENFTPDDADYYSSEESFTALDEDEHET